MNEIILDKDLIITNLDLDLKEDIIKTLSEKMYAKGFVKEEYQEAVLNREQVFPTGLEGMYINFAIPHTDVVHVNQAAIAVAVLKDGAKFNNMGDTEAEITVKMVLLLAIKNPHDQVTLLQKLMTLMQDKEIVDNMLHADNNETIVEIMNHHLYN